MELDGPFYLANGGRSSTEGSLNRPTIDLIDSAASRTEGSLACSSRQSAQVARPALRRAPCPARLTPIFPPVNFGCVNQYSIYRSAFPRSNNVDFLKRLNIRNVLCFVDSIPEVDYARWIIWNGIRHRRIKIAANKDDEISTTAESMCKALLYAMDVRHQPLLLHCNKGRHRTGCVVACLRKVQGATLAEALDEYYTYASPKQRDADVRFITEFNPNWVFEYAKAKGYLGDTSNTDAMQIDRQNQSDDDSIVAPLTRSDSGITNIGMLYNALMFGHLGCPC